MSITFRPEGPDDEPFLMQIYNSTRADEMALVPWSDEQKEAFLRMQFAAQRGHYRSRFPGASFDLILKDERPVGRLYVARLSDEIQILDITLLPGERGQGVGTPIIKDLMAEAARTGRQLQIYVESFNRSLRLFERLGFIRSGEEGIYLLMRWNAPSAKA